MFTKNLISVMTLGLGLALCASGIAKATPYSNYSSYSEVDPNIGASVTDSGTASSSASYDANNYAKSFITPGTSTMGAAASADGSATWQAYTTTTHTDSWWFNCDASHPCSSAVIPGSIPIQLAFGIKVSETQVTQNSYLEFDASYALQTSGQFNFSFVQDGLGDFELQAQYVTSSGTTVNVPVTTTLSNGIYTLTANATINDAVCYNAACTPYTTACFSGQNCSSTPAFTDTQSISALVEPGSTERDIIDGYDPFSVSIVSLDPNYQFISADGRTIDSASVSNVPEPATLPLVGVALIGFRLARRRRRC